ncbi:MAG: tRNA (guanine(46)-N(7))-methyltransferase TrmB [Pseudomonadota bacterium]
MSGDDRKRDTADEAPEELRSFGRRRGRKPSPNQQRIYDDVLPPLRAMADGDTTLTARLSAEITSGARPIWLEIGFGGSEHLIWQARANPDVLLIGCEPFLDGVIKAAAQIETDSLENVRLHDDDARPLLRALPDATIDRAFILFPDPWPKKRHVKRRLINSALLDELARVAQPGAELRVGTDIADYARTILLAVLAHPGWDWPARDRSDWTVRPEDWPRTRYEQKAEREGRRSSYFRFIRQPAAPNLLNGR